MRFDFLAGVGEYILFLSRVFGCLPKFFKRRQEFVLQMKRVGFDSLLLITLTSAFTGLVTALQAVYQARSFSRANIVGQLLGKSTMIELAPVLTALVLTGRVGAAIAAEIGSMRVSEQIDALQSMSIKPEEFLYLPRIMAGLVAFPLIVIFADLICIISAWVFFSVRYGVHYHTFFNNMRAAFESFDLISGIIKAIVFGFIITSMGCFFGNRTSGGAEGVGSSTTQTVVYSSVLILIMDFFVAWVLLGHMH
ncbi:MAG TPA: ABC transporter permease [Candidatus Syntrophosphaera sp.]|jgi:phospholipid/cholesterol/gamma-HCH transport system permease protein|nr:ABC transporter permease [Candidatus Syntrophosphaera sp.]